jgi:hypothetical protein
LLAKVPWDRSNEVINFTLELLDEDGRPTMLHTPDGQSIGIKAEAQLEVGRPPGISAGSLLDASFALNVSPLPLPPGRYEWRLEIDSSSHSTPFTVKP